MSFEHEKLKLFKISSIWTWITSCLKCVYGKLYCIFLNYFRHCLSWTYLQTRTVSMMFSRPFLHRRVDNTDYKEEKLQGQWTLGVIRYFKTMNSATIYLLCVVSIGTTCIEADMPGCCPFLLLCMGVCEHHSTR